MKYGYLSNHSSRDREPMAFLCKGVCERYGGRNRIGKGKLLESHRYLDGARYCVTCEKYFLKEICDTFNKGIYCPCCGKKTRSRSKYNPNKNNISKEERLLLVS